VKQQLQQRLMLFSTGVVRNAQEILVEQRQNIPATLSYLRRLKAIACQMKDALVEGRLDDIGHLLDESWQLKKQLARGVTNHWVDDCCQRARAAGAIGGKLTGAGGGGHLLLYCQPEARSNVRNELARLMEVPCRIDAPGSRVILNYEVAR